MAAYSFKDSNGVEHEIRVTLKTIFDVAAKCDVDLLNPTETFRDSEKTLSDCLMTDSRLLFNVVAAICNLDADDVDGRTLGEMKKAFWEAYSDFFAQSGQNWLAIAIRKDLQRLTEALKNTEKLVQDVPQENSSDLLARLMSATGSREPSGKSPDSPTPILDEQAQDKPLSSALSITPTSPENISAAPKTSTSTKKRKQKPKRKNS